MQGVLSIDLANTPFARKDVRPVLLQEGDALYIGLKPAGGVLPFAQMFGEAPSQGILRISVIANGKELPYTISADAFITEISTEAGTVRFTLDRASNALRIKGNVPLLRLASGPVFRVTTSKLPDGAEINLGGRTVYKVRCGTFEFDDSWILTRWGSVAPCLDVMPENGVLELVCYELPTDSAVPEVTSDFDECAAENKADFEAFIKTLKPTDELSAYRLWSSPPQSGAAELAGESYLFSDAKAAFRCVLASAEAGKIGIVPRFAAAALRLIDEGLMKEIPDEDIQKLYRASIDALEWWQTYRYDKVKGQYFYAYRSETGEWNPAWFKEAPVYATELQERLAQLQIVTAKLGQ